MKLPFLTFAFLLSFLVAHAQHGKVMDNLTLNSKILKGERNFAVYLPPDYETSSRSYPVLYLLHGYTDNHTGWIQFGEVLQLADNALIKGEATPMIIVMPDADTGIPGYANTLSGKWNYEDFFFLRSLCPMWKPVLGSKKRNVLELFLGYLWEVEEL